MGGGRGIKGIISVSDNISLCSFDRKRVKRDVGPRNMEMHVLVHLIHLFVQGEFLENKTCHKEGLGKVPSSVPMPLCRNAISLFCVYRNASGVGP